MSEDPPCESAPSDGSPRRTDGGVDGDAASALPGDSQAPPSPEADEEASRQRDGRLDAFGEDADAIGQAVQEVRAERAGPSAADVAVGKGRESAPAEMPVRTRPPLWLIVLTLAIPVTLGVMWYSNWYGRQLTCADISARLSPGSNPRDTYHALFQFHERAAQYQRLPADAGQREDAWAELALCVEGIAQYAENLPAEPQLQAALAEALGFFAAFADIAPNHAAAARSRLEDMLISRDTDQVGRWQAACALARHGDGRQVVRHTLHEMLISDLIPARRNAALALGMVGDMADATQLQRAAETDSDETVRVIARRAWEETSRRAPRN